MTPARRNWLWRLAEQMDWNDQWPRSFWRAVLRWQDRKHGYAGLDYK